VIKLKNLEPGEEQDGLECCGNCIKFGYDGISGCVKNYEEVDGWDICTEWEWDELRIEDRIDHSIKE
jgi:hypothetical protein